MFNYQAPADLLRTAPFSSTGAGDGIGAAAAVAYRRQRAQLSSCWDAPLKLETVYDQIEANGGKQPALFPSIWKVQVNPITWHWPMRSMKTLASWTYCTVFALLATLPRQSNIPWMYGIG